MENIPRWYIGLVHFFFCVCVCVCWGGGGVVVWGLIALYQTHRTWEKTVKSHCLLWQNWVDWFKILFQFHIIHGVVGILFFFYIWWFGAEQICIVLESVLSQLISVIVLIFLYQNSSSIYHNRVDWDYIWSSCAGGLKLKISYLGFFR
jgi:hypothetical protein